MSAHPTTTTPTRDFSQIRSVLATDCGSTTTKAILIELDPLSGAYRLTCRGEAPTTVEAPFEDVTKGVLNAIMEVEELRGRKFLDGGRIITPQNNDEGADIYISTSSAGGGLQVMVAGVVKSMTAESAARAALGAGAIVMDTLAANDRRLPHEKIERIRQLRPDMILLAGGTDGGTVSHVVKLAEMLGAANPRPRLGVGFDLPVIYAGNHDAREPVGAILAHKTAFEIVDNVRPAMEAENLSPARDKIHDLFMEHVMAQAPGYRKLMSWTDVPIMPTPGAVGLIIQAVADREGIAVVGVDIGGATTDVFSVFEGTFNRTVSANLGMSYSVSNVLAEAGLPNILRWVPFDIDEKDLRNRIGNKMIRPTTIPQTLDELKIEQAISREALRLAFIQHKEFAVSLKGVQRERTIADAFDQSGSGETLVDMMKLGLIVGSGGVLSHAPRRSQSMKMLIDAFLPEGITELAVDSIFMMPHLGVLSTVNARAATEVFEKDCLIHLGTCIAPRENGRFKEGALLATVSLTKDGATAGRFEIKYGSLQRLPLDYGPAYEVEVTPASKHIDAGAGPGEILRQNIKGGVVGLALDGRGRNPFSIPTVAATRVTKLLEWGKSFGEYPDS